MAQLGIYPKFKVFKSDETVNTEGVVNVYSTGTTTNVAAYYDADALVAQKNPLALDAEGEAFLYLSDDQKYTLTIDDISSTTNAIEGIAPVFKLESNLDINGQSIVSSSNGDISITPGSGGAVVLDGLAWPEADGTNTFIIATNGSGQLYWAPNGIVVNDTTPQLGGNLDTNSFNILFDTSHGIQDENGNEQLYFTTTSSSTDYVNITNAAASSGPTIAPAGDSTNLDLQLKGKGTGVVALSGIKYPTADGSNGDVLKTDGSGQLSLSPSEKLLQRVYVSTATVTTSTSQIPKDDTIPQNTEGAELFTKEFTPLSTTSTISVKVVIPYFSAASTGGTNTSMALFKDSDANALAAAGSTGEYVGTGIAIDGPISLEYQEVSANTTARTYKVRFGSDQDGASHPMYILGQTNSATRVFGGTGVAYMIIDEVES